MNSFSFSIGYMDYTTYPFYIYIYISSSWLDKSILSSIDISLTLQDPYFIPFIAHI